MVKVMFKTKF